VWLANSLRLAGTDVPPELAGHLTSRRRARLSEISLPVLFLVGGEDPVFLPAADLIGAEMPHSQVDIIQRATHMLIIDAADEVNRKTTEFIRQHEGEQRSCWSP
jgi:pimeloyl-ACP methyl ester carboxylesterase